MLPSQTRAASTRRDLLDAARIVFSSQGYEDAAIAEVVSRAGASVGSLYHHFGGKADLYLALYEEFAERQEVRAYAAVAQARADGVLEPMAQFVAGAKAYLDGCWEERELARLLLAGGGPPGFDLIARRRSRVWVARNAALLRTGALEEDPAGEALVLVLTTVVGEAGHEVAICEQEATARRLADEVLRVIARIG